MRRRVSVAVLMALWAGLVACDKDSGPGNGTILPGRYRVTVYYTPVQSYHGGAAVSTPYGDFPSDFLDAVETEGVGKITSGPNSGKYLVIADGGFSVSDFPPDAYGKSLRAFRTAAAQDNVLAPGTKFKLVEPLIESGGAELGGEAARRFLGATWEVRDHFASGHGNGLDLDLYIGEEDRAQFTSTSPYYILLEDATIEVFP